MANSTAEVRLGRWMWGLLAVFMGSAACGGGSSWSFADHPQRTQGLQLGPNSNTILWSISGSVSQANPNAWVAVRNGNDTLFVYGTNNFTFPTTYVSNTPYNVTVAGTDPSLTCSISNSTGVISHAKVSNVAVVCTLRVAAIFVNGFETFDAPTDWRNTIDDSWGTGGVSQVNGYCCGMVGPQAMTTDMESAHTGSGALVYSGMPSGNANDERAFLKIFDLSTLSVVGGTYLSYWIFPQSSASTFGNGVVARQSAYSAVDMTLSNGTALHFLPSMLDQFGSKVGPASQGNLVLDTWNFVLIDISSAYGETLTNLSIGWQHNGSSGGYRGYLDDIVIDYVPPPAATSLATSWEDFQTQPSWVNTVDTAPDAGNTSHVTGLCCNANGPQSYVSSEAAHTGTHALVYAGRGTGAIPTQAYTKILDLSHSNLVLDGLSVLSYWVYPQSQATFGTVSGSLSSNVALDIIFSDGATLRGSGLVDVHGNGVTPTLQSPGLVLDAWNLVSIPLGKLAGKVPVRIDVGWSEPGAAGGYRGFIDDIIIGDAQAASANRPPSLVRIILAPAPTLLVGVHLQLNATGVYSDGSKQLLNSNATFTSSNPAVASVDANGYATTLAVGVAQLRVSYQGVTSPPYTITVTPVTYNLGGTVSGLVVNTTVGLVQGRDHISVTNGSFVFPTGVAGSAPYSAALVSPAGQSCAFTGSSNAGIMPSADNTSIVVACTTASYSLGGQIAGLLSNTNVTLSVGSQTLSSTNGAYAFATPLPYSSYYNIGITSPGGQHCVFSPSGAGSGVMPAAPVSNANVACTQLTYSLGGAVSGLVTGNVTLTNTVNGDTISAGNGAYVFDQNVAYGGNYNVIATAPSGSICTLTNGNANMVVGGVSNVAVTCHLNAHALGGVVTGLLSNANVTLIDMNDTIAVSNGNFTFPTGVITNTNFVVNLTSPIGQTCIFASNSNLGVMPNANDYNIVVQCSPQSYTLGGRISGLLSNTNIVLVNGSDTAPAGNGNFTFATGVAYNSNLSITINQTPGQTCAFVGNTNIGVMPAANDYNIVVNCNVNTYILGGSISGLVSNTNVMLLNGNNSVTVQNGNFYFSQPVAYNSNFTIALTNPNGQVCVFTSNSNVGTMPAANDYGIAITCSPQTYSLGGSVSGLLTNTNVSLTNGADTISVANGNFVFPTGVVYNSNFSASLSQPSGQNCNFVSNSNSGVMPPANDMNVVLACTTNPPAYFVVSGYTSPRVAGLNSNVIITAYDFRNTIAVGYTGTVHISTASPNAVFSPNITFISGYAGSAAVPMAMVTVGTWTINANDLTTPTVSGRQTSIVVNPNLVTHLQVRLPATMVAGQPNQVLVTALDQFNNVATDYNQTVSIASSDGMATLPSSYLFSPTDQGNKVLPTTLTLYAAGAQTATVTDGYGNTPGSANITVVPASPNQIILVLPTTSVAGTPLSPNITIEDLYGNITPSFTGTVTFTSTDASSYATKPSPTAFTVGNGGKKVFTNGLVFATAGNQTLTVTDTPDGLLAASQVVVVSPNIVTNVNMTLSPTVTAGQTQNMTLAVFDAYGNAVTNYTGSINLDTNDYQSVVTPLSYTFGSSDMGTTNISVMLATAGTRYIHAIASTTGNPNKYVTVTVSPNTLNRLLFYAPQVVSINTAFGGTLSGVDLYGNLVSGYSGSISISSSDPNGSPAMGAPSTVSVTSGGNVALTGLTFGTLDAQTLTATDATHTVSATQAFVVHPVLNFTNGQNGNAQTHNVGNNAGNLYYGANGRLYHGDSFGSVFAIWNTLPINNASPNTVISTSGATTVNSLNVPMSIAPDGNTGIFVVDNGSHRVVHYNTIPTSSLTADSVIGQQTFTGSTATCSPNGLSRPTDIAVVPNANAVLVADCGNSRVVVYSPIPYKNGANATLALGQTSLTTCSTSGVSATRVAAYCGGSITVWTDGQRIAVGDAGNNRVLIFNSLQAILQRGTNAPAADIVIGQATMTGTANPGTNPNAYSLYTPQFITSDGTQLVVTDTVSHRALLYNPFPTGNRPAASTVLGQSTFATGTAASTAAGLNYPQGVTIAKNYLFVSDHQNGRLMLYTSQ